MGNMLMAKSIHSLREDVQTRSYIEKQKYQKDAKRFETPFSVSCEE